MVKSQLLNKLFVLLVVSCLGSSAWAANEEAGTSGAAFLKLDQSIRSASLGGSFVAVADDPSTMFSNPAGLQLYGLDAISFAYNNWLVDTNYSTFCITRAKGVGDAFGVAISYLNFGSIQETTATARTGTGKTFNPNSFVGILSWGRNIDRAIIGASLKVISQNIDNAGQNGLGLDFGLLSRTPMENMRLGLSLLNLGSFNNNSLPQTFLLGLHWQVPVGLNLSLDLRWPRDGAATLHGGVEYRIISALTLRAGLNNRSLEGAGGNYGLGLGLNLKKFNVDYAYVPYGDLGSSHRLGLSLEL